VLADRASRWSPHPARYETGALAKYARLVGSAETGAVTG
jgi:dihydroxy-acid dehydratase